MGGDVNMKVEPVDILLNGLDNIGANVDLGLDDVNLRLTLDDVSADLKTRLTLDPVDADLKTRLTLDEVKADIRASVQASLTELAPIIFSFLWKEIPIVRVGCPHRYRLSFSLCGKEIFAISLCGESELITERNTCGEKGAGDGQG